MDTRLVVVLLAVAVVALAWGICWIADRAPKAEQVWAPMEHNPTWDHELSCRCRTCRS